MPYSDGTFPSGAGTVIINNVTYKCNAFAYTKAAQTYNTTNGFYAPSGALSYELPLTGTAEIQFSASNVAEPTTAADNYVTGIMLANVSGANVALLITSCVINKPKDAPWTASVAWQKAAFSTGTPLTVTSDPASVYAEKLTPTPASNVTLVATAAGGYAPYSYEWLGEGIYTNTFTGSYTLADFTVTCRATDAIGNTADVNVDIYIGLV